MCGRYVFVSEPLELKSAFPELVVDKDWSRRYNISPSELVPAIIFNKSIIQIAHLKWGLVPKWMKTIDSYKPMINARSETILEKPSFKEPFLKTRCLLPANGFYEWKKNEKINQPYFISCKTKRLFYMAGIYEIWKNKEGAALESCCILTTKANLIISPIHNRMPVIVPENSLKLWLSDKTPESELLSILNPYTSEEMQLWPVDRKLNSLEEIKIGN